jgi:Family of unknown function (DUF5681)
MTSSTGNEAAGSQEERFGDKATPTGSGEAKGGEERVGYGKPPVRTRFRQGQSGNPRGRPKGARNLSTIVAAALGERVTVTENGRRRHITKYEATVKQVVNRATTGDLRAAQVLFGLAQANEAQAAPANADRIGVDDMIVMAEMMRRMKKQAS